MNNQPVDLLVSALVRLCNKVGGPEVVASATGLSKDNLWQIINGIRLPSGNPRGVGPKLRSALTSAYPDWLATGEGEMSPTLTGATNVTHFPVVTLEAAMERLSYFLEQVPEADRGSSSAALAALALNPADHARKAALIKLLIEPSLMLKTEKIGSKVP